MGSVLEFCDEAGASGEGWTYDSDSYGLAELGADGSTDCGYVFVGDSGVDSAVVPECVVDEVARCWCFDRGAVDGDSYVVSAGCVVGGVAALLCFGWGLWCLWWCISVMR